MLHRTLGVAFAVCLGAAPIGAVGASITDGAAVQHVVPEPSTLALFGLGVALVGIGFVRRRPNPRQRPKS
jgi:hypothetical protein